MESTSKQSHIRIRKIPYILYGCDPDAGGHGGFGRRERTNLPKGTPLMFALRGDDGIRHIKTEDRRYFVLVRR